jgi:hypothetical protein
MSESERPDQKTCPRCKSEPSDTHCDPWSAVFYGWCFQCRDTWVISRPTKEEIDQKIVGYLSD